MKSTRKNSIYPLLLTLVCASICARTTIAQQEDPSSSFAQYETAVVIISNGESAGDLIYSFIVDESNPASLRSRLISTALKSDARYIPEVTDAVQYLIQKNGSNSHNISFMNMIVSTLSGKGVELRNYASDLLALYSEALEGDAIDTSSASDLYTLVLAATPSEMHNDVDRRFMEWVIHRATPVERPALLQLAFRLDRPTSNAYVEAIGGLDASDQNLLTKKMVLSLAAVASDADPNLIARMLNAVREDVRHNPDGLQNQKTISSRLDRLEAINRQLDSDHRLAASPKEGVLEAIHNDVQKSDQILFVLRWLKANRMKNSQYQFMLTEQDQSLLDRVLEVVDPV